MAEIADKRKFIFNAMVEKLSTSPMWKPKLANRCIIPASGFYEWEKVNGKTGAKYEITVPGEPVFGFAALHDDVPNPKTGEMERTLWIITTPPNPGFADFHDRQPVILDKSEYDEWLLSKKPPLPPSARLPRRENEHCESCRRA